MFEGIFEPWHLVILLVIILIIFGPGKLPELGSALGRGIKEFRGGIKDAAEALDDPTPAAATNVPSPSPAASVTVEPPATTTMASTMSTSDSPSADAPLVTPTVKTCAQCGSALDEGSRFCSRCGTPTGAQA